MSMRDDRKQWLDSILKTVSTTGWELFEREMSLTFESMTRGKWQECKTGEEFLKAKGEIEMLAKVLSFSKAVKAEVENFDALVFADEQAEAKNELEE